MGRPATLSCIDWLGVRLRRTRELGGCIGDRKPLLELFLQLRERHGLCEVVIHSGGVALLRFSAQRVGGARNDGRASFPSANFGVANVVREAYPLHPRLVEFLYDAPNPT